MKKFSLISRMISAPLLLIFVGAGCLSSPPETASEGDEEPTLTLENDNGLVSTDSFQGLLPAEEINGKIIRLSTDRGDIILELFAETAPQTVSNFVRLTKNGYYNGLTFHRREEGFVIQGGDPNGNGTGGPGYTFEDELADDYSYDRGIVAMANRGPNTNGSQFFIMLADYPLPKLYTIFGRVVEGLEVVDQIQVGDVMRSVAVEEKSAE